MEPSTPTPFENEVVDRLSLKAANDGEALISAARSAFCLLVLGRFLTLDPAGGNDVSAKWAVEIGVLALAAAISALTFTTARQGRLRPVHFVVSSVGDAAMCFVSLLSNVLWPDPGYLGLLRMPDIAATLPVIFVSALRLTPPATVASVVANLASLASLVSVDMALNGPRLRYDDTEVTMVLIMVLTVGIATWVAAHGAVKLVRRAGRETAQLGRARRRLDALLREHHDVRTLLSTARVNLQLALERPSTSHDRLVIVDAAMEELADFVEGVRSQTFAEIAVLEGIRPAGLLRAVRAATEVARHRFTSTEIDFDAPHVAVDVVGGERALLQVVFNLVANACEGAGTSAASRVHLHASVAGRNVVVTVDDDGPGFLPELIAADAQFMPSTKTGGSGLGLMLVSDLITQSGGSVVLRNRSEGGASVMVQLPISATDDSPETART